MAWFWFAAGFVLLALLIDKGIERMYAYPIVPPRRTPAQYDIPYEEVRIPSEDGGQLAAWWIPGEAGKPALVLIHGWSRNRERLLPHIRQLHALGYHLLAFDARNHGASTPLNPPNVWSFTEDACAAIRWLEREHPTAARQLGVLGLSIGGGAAINAAALCPQIRAVITVGAIGHPVATMRWEMEKHHLPDFLIRLVLAYTQWRYRLDFDKIAPVNHVGQVKGRILLIHGDQDETVALQQAHNLHTAAPPERCMLWVVPGKGHSNCCTHPEFWPRVTDFLQSTFANTAN